MIVLKNKLYQPLSVFVSENESVVIKGKGSIKIAGEELSNHVIQLKNVGHLSVEIRKQENKTTPQVQVSSVVDEE